MTMNGRVGYHVQRGSGFKERNRHFKECQAARIPAITVQPKKGGAYASVDTMGVGQGARFDVTADVKIRAIFGQCHTLDGAHDLKVGRCSYYTSTVKGAGVEELGSALAAVVEEGLPFMATITPNGVEAQATRAADWSTLAAFFAERVRDERTARAIRLGYYLFRGVKNSECSDYAGYCDLAGRPLIVCDVKRSRAEVRYSFGRLRPRGYRKPVDGHIETVLESVMGRAAMKAAKIHHFGSSASGAFVNVPKSVVPRVATELYELALDDQEVDR